VEGKPEREASLTDFPVTSYSETAQQSRYGLISLAFRRLLTLTILAVNRPSTSFGSSLTG
jgi:hypothetical protein